MSDVQIKFTANTAQAERALKNLSNQSNLLGKALGAAAAFFGTRQLVNYTTQWTDLNSRLKNATGSAENAALAMASIERTARKTYSPLADTADVFIRNSMALNELGYTTSEQVKVSEALNNAIVVSGARGQQAASAMDAFAKSIARGKFEGEDFNRIIENSPRLVQALADGIGVTTQELRQMVTDGVLTSSVAIQALTSQLAQLSQEADDMPATISDAFVILENKLLSTVGSMDRALGVSSFLANAIIGLADNTTALIGGLAGLSAAMLYFAFTAGVASKALAALGISWRSLGFTALITAAGVALGYLIDKLGLFEESEKSAAEITAQMTKEIEEQAAAAAKRQKIMNEMYEAAQDKNIQPLLQELEIQKKLVQASEYEKRLREELQKIAQKLKITEDQISAANRTKVENLLLATMAQEHELAIAQNLRGVIRERNALKIQDVKLREIAVAIDQQEIALNRQLTDLEKERITQAYESLQQKREEAAIIDSINQYLGRTVTLSQQVSSGLSLAGQLRDPIEREKDSYIQGLTDLNAAREALGTENIQLQQEINDAIEQLAINHQNKLTELERAAIDERWRQKEQAYAKELSATRGLFGEQMFTMEEADQLAKEKAANEKAYEADKTRYIIGKGVEAFQAFATQSKQAFEAYKALKIAETIMTTYSSAVKAYESTVGLPVVGPFLAPVMAAAAVAAGMAQVAQIRSMNYSGRALGGPVLGGESYMVGERGPEMFTPATSGRITRNQDLVDQQPVTVNFNITTVDAADFDTLLYSRRAVITNIINNALQKRGKEGVI